MPSQRISVSPIWLKIDCKRRATSIQATDSAPAPSDRATSGFDDRLKSAVHHSLCIERHRRRFHHLHETRVLHHLFVDAIPVGARLEHDVREQDRLAGFGLNSARERQPHFHVQIVADIRGIRARRDPSTPSLLPEPGGDKSSGSSSEQVKRTHQHNEPWDIL